MRVKTAFIIAAFAFAVLVFFFEVLVGPEVLLDTNPNHLAPWKYYASQEDLSSKSHRTDSILDYLPRYVELRRSIRSGRFPLWNPHILGGTPLFADPQGRVVYPVSLLLVALDPERAMGYDVAIHFLIALVGMYTFLRVIGATFAGSAIGAFSYGFSSFFFLRMGHPTLIASASWIPFIFYSFEKARTGGHGSTVLLAVFIALGYLSGFPQVFLFGIGSLLVYALYLALDEGIRGTGKTTGLKFAKILGVAALLSLLLVSVNLVPFVEFIRNSIGLDIPFETMKDVYVAQPVMLVRTICPGFFGNPLESTDWSGLSKEVVHPYNPDFMVYCGMGSLVLAVGSLVFLRRSARLRAFLILTLLAFAIGTSPPIARAAYALIPVFRYSKVSRVSVIACFGLSAMGGLSFSMLCRENDGRIRKLFRYTVLGTLIATLAAALVFAFSGESIVARYAEKARSVPDEFWLNLQVQLCSIRIRDWAQTMSADWLVYEQGQAKRSLLFMIPSGLLLVLLSFCRTRWRGFRDALPLLFGGLLALDLGVFAHGYFVSQAPHSITETQSIGLLRQGVGADGRWRIRGMRFRSENVVAFPENTNQLFGIQSFHGTSTIVPATHAGISSALEGCYLPLRLIGRQGPLSPIEFVTADLGCVRYIVTRSNAAPYTPVPVLSVIASGKNTWRQLRILQMDNGARLAVRQGLNEGLNIVMNLPPLRRIEFAPAFNSVAESPGDSVVFTITCEREHNKAEFKQSFDLYQDKGMWRPAQLDISSLGGGITRIRTAITGPETVRDKVLSAGWSGFDLVFEDCRVREINRGFEIGTGGSDKVLCLELLSQSREVPLELTFDTSRKALRWVSFPSHMPTRRIMLDLGPDSRQAVRVTSDSLFTLAQAKIVHSRDEYLYCDLIYDRDMHIYENLAALTKGICLDKDSVRIEDIDGQRTAMLACLTEMSGILIGECDIISYAPERVVLHTSSESECILLVQDTQYPGWKASVDGTPTPFLRNDLGMRAIELEKGSHEIVMEFKPGSVILGIVLTCLGFLLCLLYAVTRDPVRAGRKASPRYAGP